MTPSAFDTSAEAALRAIDEHRGTLLVDLDETLYLRNSTEDFIGSAWPGPLAFLLMKALDLCRPWRWSGGVCTRDVWRVATILVLMPWSLPVWRRTALRLGREAANLPLVQALKVHGQASLIVTLGFRPIVAPLAAAMGLRDIQLVAMSPWRFRDRRQGKRAMVAKRIGPAQLSKALCITDSLDDLDLLQACLRPLRVIWPQARFQEAFHDVYMPGLYISRVKRPGVRYIYRGIISDEYSVWVLASITLATQPLLHILGLALLSVSFWAIYEDGYVDNDQVGARHERDARLSRQFFENTVRSTSFLPWTWAAVCGVAALLLLRWPLGPAWTDLLAWGAVLLLTFSWFRFYNRVDKRTRVWLFAGLQLLRSVSFVAVVSVTLVGMVALIAHVLARWVPYYTYRLTRTGFNDEALGSSRLLFFILICGGLAMAIGWDPFLSSTGLALLLWFVFKARRELVAHYRRMHFIGGRRPSELGAPASYARARPAQRS